MLTSIWSPHFHRLSTFPLIFAKIYWQSCIFICISISMHIITTFTFNEPSLFWIPTDNLSVNEYPLNIYQCIWFTQARCWPHSDHHSDMFSPVIDNPIPRLCPESWEYHDSRIFCPNRTFSRRKTKNILSMSGSHSHYKILLLQLRNSYIREQKSSRWVYHGVWELSSDWS